MASVLRSLKRDPSLYPLVCEARISLPRFLLPPFRSLSPLSLLIVAVGAGVLGSVSFAAYYLSKQARLSSSLFSGGLGEVEFALLTVFQVVLSLARRRLPPFGGQGTVEPCRTRLQLKGELHVSFR